jgi:hypothetical protein
VRWNTSRRSRCCSLKRVRLDRVEPERIADEVAAGAILVDIRPIEQRQRDGGFQALLAYQRETELGQI